MSRREKTSPVEPIDWKADASTLKLLAISNNAASLGWPLAMWTSEADAFVNRIHPSDRDRTVELVRATAADGRHRCFMHRLLNAAVEPCWYFTTVRLDATSAARICGRSSDLAQRYAAKRRPLAERCDVHVDGDLPVLLWTTDRKLRFTCCSGGGLEALNLTPELLVGLSLFEFLQTENRVDPNIGPSLRALGGETVRYEAAWHGRVFQALVAPRRSGAGRILGTAGVAFDVTSRALSDLLLRNSEERIRSILGASPDSIQLKTSEGVWLEANDAAQRVFGIAPEFRGLTDIELAAAYPRLREALLRCAESDNVAWRSGHTIKSEEDVPLPNGRMATFEANKTPVFDADGRRKWLVVIARDVTERRRIERERDELLRATRAAEERAAFLSGASRAISISIEPKGLIAALVRAAIPYLADWCVGYLIGAEGRIEGVAAAHADANKAALVEKLIPLPQRADVDSVIAKAIRGEESVVRPNVMPEDPTVVLGLDGSSARELVAALGLRSCMALPLVVREKVVGAVLFVSTREDRPPYDETTLALGTDLVTRAGMAVDHANLLQEAREALLARDTFLSIASHELRTPCSTLMLRIQSLLRALQKRPLAPGELERALGICDAQVRQLAQLIDRLLDVSRIHTGRLALEPEDMDLVEVVNDCTSTFAMEAERVGSSIAIEAEAPVVGRWDRRRLEQVCANLLSNAIKYGAGKPIEIRVRQNAGHALLTVQDHGIGIATDQQGRLFERFERAVSAKSYGGLGLGLFIVREIVEAHGGNVRLKSEPGVGSELTVELPLAIGAQEPSSELAA